MSDKFKSGYSSSSADLIKFKGMPKYQTAIRAILTKEGITGYKLDKHDADRYHYSIGTKKYFVRNWPMPQKDGSLWVEYAIHRD